MKALLTLSLPACVALATLSACSGSSESAPPPAQVPEAGNGAVPPPAPHPASTEPSTTKTTWCTESGPHDFCADFDDGSSPWGWDGILEGNLLPRDKYGVVESSRSLPNAFHLKGASLEEPDGGTDPFSQFGGLTLRKKLPTTERTKARLSFDILIGEMNEMLDVFQLSGRMNGGRDIAYGVWVTDNGRELAVAARDGEVPGVSPLPQGRWVHVDVLVDDHGGQGGTVEVSYDGKAVGSVPFSGTLSSSTETTLHLGNSRSAPSRPYELSYDNVTFDFL